ncbi:Ribosomal protein S18 acetylase RimI [Devosia psychrophila]|uniref:Ribosomal protein S18 acetylase RimI n=2 Tax=Devosia psychrophila TaxID=728005 RepID=A0A1I1R7C5_9HYPH|nr:Ribosomal protein S18 acetylase RimI [Devosia psychrophila]
MVWFQLLIDEPMTSSRIRAAAASDLDALIDLEFAAFTADRISRRSWHSLIESLSATIIVAEIGGQVAGSAVLLFNQKTSVARVYSLAVSAPARGQGLGARLLESAIEKAERRGLRFVRLETRVDNMTAQRLFETCGFVPFERTATYYEDGTDALRYQRVLPGIGAAGSLQ